MSCYNGCGRRMGLQNLFPQIDFGQWRSGSTWERPKITCGEMHRQQHYCVLMPRTVQNNPWRLYNHNHITITIGIRDATHAWNLIISCIWFCQIKVGRQSVEKHRSSQVPQMLTYMSEWAERWILTTLKEHRTVSLELWHAVHTSKMPEH